MRKCFKIYDRDVQTIQVINIFISTGINTNKVYYDFVLTFFR